MPKFSNTEKGQVKQRVMHVTEGKLEVKQYTPL